jgi:hypothetical protein
VKPSLAHKLQFDLFLLHTSTITSRAAAEGKYLLMAGGPNADEGRRSAFVCQFRFVGARTR